jgi:Flp pilus assembly pilin Flp
MNWNSAAKRFVHQDDGQSLIEYSLIAVLIGLAASLALTSVQTSIASVFNTLGSVI